jgi:hypothetical protein
MVVSAEEWERKTKRVGNLSEFFPPLRRTGQECDLNVAKAARANSICELAATAQIHKLTLATRNQSDLKSSVYSIVNPCSIQ